MMQDYVIETHEQYPRRMVFNVFGEDKIKQFNIQMDEELNVFFDINAREFNGRWYNDIRAWRVDRVTPGQMPPQAPPAAQTFAPGPQPATQPTAQQPAVQAPQVPVDFTQGDATDDLPF